VLIGFIFLLGSRLVPHSIGEILVVIGGLIVAYAHYVNWQLLQGCKHCMHPNHQKKEIEKKITPPKQIVELEEVY